MDVNHYLETTTLRAMEARRQYMSSIVRSQFDSITQYGILKGFRVPHSNWAEVVSSAYILGTYEVAVCAILDSLKSNEKTLVDLGGADGIFGVGLVEVGAFGRSLIFELDETRRRAIVDLAQSRGLDRRVGVFGAAEQDLVRLIAGQEVAPGECVVLCDIEGAEFGLFTDDLLRQLKDAHVIIELHDFLLSDPQARDAAVETLKRAAGRHFQVCEIKDGLRDIRSIPGLPGWSDWDTYLQCVEARYRMMSWLWLRPKNEPHLAPAAVDALILDYQRRIFSE